MTVNVQNSPGVNAILDMGDTIGDETAECALSDKPVRYLLILSLGTTYC
jgi:hypothetical protein